MNNIKGFEMIKMTKLIKMTKITLNVLKNLGLKMTQNDLEQLETA